MSNDVKAAVDANDLVMDLVLGLKAETPALAPLVALQTRNVRLDMVSDLASRLPFVMVNHWDGDVDLFSTRPIVDLAVFASAYVTARDIARLLERRLLGYPFRVSSGGRSVLVDRVEVATPTVEVPWQQDSPIRKFQGTYQLSIRR